MTTLAASDFIAELERRHGHRVRSKLSRSRLSGEQVEDVWNRVLVAAWRVGASPEWWEHPEHEEAWVRAMVKMGVRYARLYAGRARYRAKAQLFSEMETDDGRGVVAFVSYLAAVATSPGASLEWQDRALLQAWEATPPKQRRAVELVILQGMSYGEAGRLVGSSKATMATHVRRGLVMLRRRYEEARAAA